MTQDLIDDDALATLIRTVPDGVLHPGDPELATAATTLAGQGTPALAVRPTTTEGVAAAVAYARRHDLPLTVRAGGHSMSGASTAAGGMLIDLRRMDAVQIEPQTQLVRIGGGATWGAVAAALRPHGLGLTAGDTADVGVGGLTLGGGVGWMVRLHGLAIDNLVGAEIVMADGEIRRVSEQQHPDLFWAVRGGGGGFGIVTRFDFLAQEVADVVFGTIVYALDDASRLLGAWQTAQRDADERLTTTLTLLPAMGDRPPSAMAGVCFAGPEADSVEVLRPFMELGTVLSTDVSVRPYAEVLEDARHPAGMRTVVDNVMLPSLEATTSAELADLHAAGGTVVSLRGLGGAAGRIPADATAFAHRSAEVMVTAARFSPGPDAPTLDGAPGWAAVAARGTGSYVNFLSAATPTAFAAAYPGTTGRRLAAIRAEHDPTGLFR